MSVICVDFMIAVCIAQIGSCLSLQGTGEDNERGTYTMCVCSHTYVHDMHTTKSYGHDRTFQVGRVLLDEKQPSKTFA